MKYVAKALLTSVAAILIVGAYANRAIAAPPTPTNPSPGSTSSPGPTTSSISVTLRWSASSGATTYGVGVRDMSTNVLVVDSNTSSTSYTANLSAGRPYRWNVNACNSTGCSSFTTVLYFQTPASLPPTPGNPSPGSTSSPGPITSSTSVTLSWSTSTGATTYGVGVRDMSTNVLVVDTNTSSTSHSVALTAGRPYRWNVNACNSAGCSSFTGVRYFQTPSAATLPSAPRNLAASGGNGVVGLAWNAPSSNGGATITNYRVFRGTTSSNRQIVTSGGCASLGTVLECADTSVANGQSYNYIVSAVNSAGQGPGSNSATATPTAPVPNAPSGLIATSSSSTAATLTWADNSNNETGFKIERKRGTGGSYAQVGAQGQNLNFFNDSGLTAGTQYCYRVRATNSAGDSSYSNDACTTTQSAVTLPGAPQNLAASGGNGVVGLAWNAPSSNGGATITSYRVFRGTNSSNRLIVTSGGCANLGAVLGCADTSVTNGQTYDYIVSAVNSAGQGAPSNSATAIPSAGTDKATFVSETILDGTQLAAGQAFTKSWTIRNSGTTTWNSNYRLRWVSGANLSNHGDVVITGSVVPGSIYTFIVPMTAPTSGGTYREDWKLTSGSGSTIPVSSSGTIWVSIKVANSSGTDKADFVAETHLDGTTVPAGQGFTKNWTVRNSGTTTWSSNYRLRWVSGANLSNHTDVAISGSVPPGSSYTFSVPMTAPNATGTYREDWKLINGSGATVPISASSTIWVSVRVNVGGQSSITGSVTSSSGVPIAGANVQVGNNNTQSNSQGAYSISNIAAGDYTATVSKIGHATFSGPLTITANTQVRRDFILQASVPVSGIAISSIATKYRGKIYFLDGISQNVTFTANVDWGGHSPAKVLFITPRGSYEVATNSATASKTLDVGSEFGTCGKLRIRAVSNDGTTSQDKLADFVVMSKALTGLKPEAANFIRFIDLGDNFHYEFSLGSDLTFFDELIDGGAIPADFPIFGRKGFGLRFIPTVTIEISNNGEARYQLAFNNKRKPLFKFLDKDFGLEPLFEITGNFSESTCNWKWGGFVGAKGSFEFDRLPAFRPPLPLPFSLLYVKPSGGVSINALGGFASFAPPSPTPNIKFDVKPHLDLSLGAGVDMIFAAAVTGSGGAELKFQWPETPHVKDATLFVSAKVGIYGLLHLEQEVFRCDYSVIARIGGCTAGSSSSSSSSLFRSTPDFSSFKAAPRDYIKMAGYGKFPGGMTVENRLRMYSATQSSSTSTAAIQLTVFPYSEANVSASNNNLYLAWLYDNPERASMNRSMAVFSSWDGTVWNDPQAINDDGTADFHPQLLTFSDGSALAAWEDVKSALPETASVGDVAENLEVSTSFYDPGSNSWSQVRRMTANGYVDRSPKLAGPSADDALIVWISNEQNDLAGNAAKPNTLWAAKWNGTSWTTPLSVASIPYGVVKYDFAYSGGKGDVLLSLDTDNDRSTNEDHELYALHYENGVWGNLTRLTNDNVTDDNPLIATDSKGNQALVWVKGNEIYSAANRNIDGRKLVAAPGYSTNVADFKLAHTAEGRIALIWAEPSGQFASDLQALFYDPALDIWGIQSQLSADQELESGVAAAFYGNNLIAIYDRTMPSLPTSSQDSKSAAQQTSIPAPGTTDLYMLTRAVGGDLAIKPNTLETSPGNPRPGEVTTLTATILNQGDIGTRDVPVSFYQGNPASGGILIGTTLVSTTLPPGDEQQIAIPWIPASTTSPFSIYVIVDPNQVFDDANRTNNVASKQVVRADLAIQSIRWERRTENSVLVTARLVNLGSLPTLPTSVSFRRDSSTGPLLSSPAMGGLDPDQSVDVAIQWDTTGFNAPEYTLYLLADPNNSVDEYDKTNNVATLVVSLNASVATIQLLLDQSGSAPDQMPALDSVLFTRDPFMVTNPANSLNPGSDRNTRVMIFITNLRPSPGEPSSSVVVNLVDSNNQSYDIAAEDVRPVPNFDFTQVIFRLPNNLPVGTCTIKVKAHDQVSNAGTIRIRI